MRGASQEASTVRKGHPEEVSDGEEDVLEGYTSEESNMARAFGGVGMEEDSLLGSGTETDGYCGGNFKGCSSHFCRTISTTISDVLLLHLAVSGANVALIQEPWIYGDKIRRSL